MTLDERSAVPALDRGLDILECMAGSTEALSLTELARAVGRTVSEVQRTVAQLAARAYLVRDARGAYRLSSKLFRLATAYPPFRDLVSRALAPMQEFAGATTEGVHLGVLSDDQLLLIAQVEGQGIVRLSMQLGSTQEALTTVSGRILLSGLTPAELAAFETRLGLSRIERTRLRESCAKIRGRGYEYAESGRVHGVEDVGVPVLLPGPSVIAALTTSFLPLRNAKPAPLPLISALRKAAARIASSYEPTLVSAALPERTGAKKARAHGTRAR
jgi:DNA-binding IclR family transcriptional regulator